MASTPEVIEKRAEAIDTVSDRLQPLTEGLQQNALRRLQVLEGISEDDVVALQKETEEKYGRDIQAATRHWLTEATERDRDPMEYIALRTAVCFDVGRLAV